MKKKIIAMSLALVVVAGVGKGIVAKAETVTKKTADGSFDTSTGATLTKDVNITFSGVTAKVYSVDITWDTLVGTSTSAEEWDPNTHSYTSAAESVDFSGNNKVTVVNHSNASVNCTYEFAKDTTSEGSLKDYPNNSINGTINNSKTILESAVNVGKDSADQTSKLTSVGTLTVTGSLNTDTVPGNAVKVGTVTVTLTP